MVQAHDKMPLLVCSCHSVTNLLTLCTHAQKGYGICLVCVLVHHLTPVDFFGTIVAASLVVHDEQIIGKDARIVDEIVRPQVFVLSKQPAALDSIFDAERYLVERQRLFEEVQRAQLSRVCLCLFVPVCYHSSANIAHFYTQNKVYPRLFSLFKDV